MQIHELNTLNRMPEATDFLAIDTGFDTAKIPANSLFADEEMLGTIVSEWLNDHPEATTTVEDGSLTEPKFSPMLKLQAIKDYVTPQMFGAAADGVTDDTTAIKDALNSGKPVYLPIGTYLITTGLSLNAHNVVIGENQLLSKLLFKGVTESAITISGDYIHFENFTINSDSFDYTVKGTDNAYKCIDGTNVHFCTFNNLRVVGFNYGFYLYQAWSNSLTNVIVLCCNTGVYGGNEFNQIAISHCALNWCLKAIELQGGRSVYITNCDIEHNSIGAFITEITDARFIGCYFEVNENGSIHVDWAYNAVPMCTIADCSFFENATCTGIIFYHMAATGRLVLERNYFRSNDLGATLIPILTPLNPATLVVPILIENVLGNNFKVGVTNYVDYNFMPIAINKADFMTLNNGYSLEDFALYKMGRHIFGSFSVVKSTAFTTSGQNTVGTPKAGFEPMTNVNIFGPLSNTRWGQSTDNLCYIFLSPTALTIQDGDGTSTVTKVMLNYVTKA